MNKTNAVQQTKTASSLSPAQGLLQRKCACGNHTVAGGECAECGKEKAAITLQRALTNTEPVNEVPPIVHEVLRSSGQPLDPSVRAFFEPRFGHDFSRVRVHADAKAAESAPAVNAVAYTVGNHIVFGSGAYRPTQPEGRRLLAHELTHVVQQQNTVGDIQTLTIDGGSADPHEQEAQRVSQMIEAGQTAPTSISAGSAKIQRQPILTNDAAGGCGVFFGGDVRKVGNVAHDLIQTEFELMYPGLTRNFPLFLKGKKQFIISEGLPDLILPTPTGLKIGEIKPANLEGYVEGGAKIEIYKRLAKEKYNVPTPTITIEPLDVAPPPPMPFFEPAAIDCPQTLVTGPSVGGVYGYLCWPPFKELRKKCKPKKEEKPDPLPLTGDEKEVERQKKKDTKKSEPGGVSQPSPIPALVAVTFAALAFLIKKFGVKVAGGYAYAVAGLLAVSYLLASRRAEAKLGLGEDEPLVQLFKALEQQGTPVPPEIQQLIENNKELKAKLEQGIKPSGDVNAAQQEINQQILKILQEHKSEFTDEELELILGATGVAGQNLPQGVVTVQTLHTMLNQARARGGSGSESQGKGNVWERAKETGTKPSETPQGTPGQQPPGKRSTEQGNVWEEAKQTGEATIEIEKKYPGLSQEARNKLVSAKASVRNLFAFLVRGKGGSPISDEFATRFLGIVPTDLTDEQVDLIIRRFTPTAGQNLDEIFESLKKAVDEVRTTPQKPTSGSANPTEPSAEREYAPAKTPTASGGVPSAASPEQKGARESIFNSPAFNRIKAGTMAIFPSPTDKSKLAAVTIIGISRSGRKYAGTAQVQLIQTSQDGKTLRIKILSATDLVGPDGNIEHESSLITGNESNWSAIR